MPYTVVHRDIIDVPWDRKVLQQRVANCEDVFGRKHIKIQKSSPLSDESLPSFFRMNKKNLKAIVSDT